MFAKKRSPHSPALILYIGGGAGAGKSWVLKAIKAFIECPALVGQIEKGGMLAVAFQGKQAASVGGTTIHSVCTVPGRKGSGGKDHDDQKGLTEDQALYWKNKSVLAVEEASMVSCEMELALNKAACGVFPMHKDKPFGNMVTVFCGDFNQLR